jgi:hypothetical protein
MMFRTLKTRKNVAILSTLTAVLALSATIFAPAGFGSRPRIALWDDQPIILAVPPTVAPGETLNCAVDFEDATTDPVDPNTLRTATKAATSESKNVTVYSDPPGVVSYSGTVDGSSAVIPAAVAHDATPGPVTVYVETDGSTAVSATTTVVNH